MKAIKLLFGFSALLIAAFLLIPEKNKPIDFNSIYKVPSESSKDRKIWNTKRLVSSDGTVPKNIRTKELKFAQDLPNDLNNSNLSTLR